MRIGVRPTVTKFTIDYSKYVFWDEFDPLNRTSKESRIKTDLDLGLWFQYKNFYSGLALNNLFDHKFYFTMDSLVARDYFANRSLTVIAGKKFSFKNIELEPSVAVFNQQKYFYVTISNNLTLYNLIMLGGTFIKSVDNYSDFNNVTFNGGVNIKNKFQIIGLIYGKKHHTTYYKDYKYFEGMVRVKI